MIQTIKGVSNKTWRELLKDQRGNVLMFYGFAVIPLVFSVGMGIDYARAMKTQTKLNAAADAAALNSVSQTMMVQSTTNACNAAKALFEAQSADIESAVVDSVTYSIKKADGTEIGCETITDDAPPVDKRLVTVAYRAQSTNLFGGLLGWANLTISGSSGTYASVAPDIDFYIALDTSLSMALPTTSAGISALHTATGCTFACHSNKLENYIQSGTGHINRLIADSTLMGLNKGNYGSGSITESKQGNCNKWNNWGQCTGYETINTVYTYKIIDSSGRYIFDNKPYENGKAHSTCNVGGLDKCVRNRIADQGTQGVYADSYWYALNQGIRLRVTDQKLAVKDLMDLADTYQDINNAEYRAAVYTFDHANHGSQGVTRVSPLATDLPGVGTAAENADLSILNDISGNGCPKTGCTSSNRYLYTSFKSIMTALSPGGAYPIPNPGNGTEAPGDTPQAFMFLITDGMSDEYICNSSNSCTSGRTRSAMQQAQINQCNALKARKIKVAILYTEYTYDSIKEDEPGQREIARKAIQGDGQKSIEQALTECASPGLMYTVRTNESISNALQALFSKALATARIIQ